MLKLQWFVNFKGIVFGMNGRKYKIIKEDCLIVVLVYAGSNESQSDFVTLVICN